MIVHPHPEKRIRLPVYFRQAYGVFALWVEYEHLAPVCPGMPTREK